MTEPEQTLYTRAEAYKMVLSEQCIRDGHDLEHVVNAKGDITVLYCGHCGARWRLVREN